MGSRADAERALQDSYSMMVLAIARSVETFGVVPTTAALGHAVAVLLRSLDGQSRQEWIDVVLSLANENPQEPTAP